MNEKEFEAQLLELLHIHASLLVWPEEDVLVAMKEYVEYKNGGSWGDGTAREIMREFEWGLSKKTPE